MTREREACSSFMGGQAGRSQGVETADTAKGCSHPPEVDAATGR